jgi:hypothetical protein
VLWFRRAAKSPSAELVGGLLLLGAAATLAVVGGVMGREDI